MHFGQALAVRTPPGVRSLVVHPGLVLTTLYKEQGPGGNDPSAMQERLDGIPTLRQAQQAPTPLQLVLKTPEEGARTLIYALLAPGLRNGDYLVDCEVKTVANALLRATQLCYPRTGSLFFDHLPPARVHVHR